ncbi:RDD family protein [Streptomyces sp. NPDC018031]|uniref:RDD family protein n=1 Tax=Streptomyces sp. NPDC018031 TaxID=3365033 RepID=UPI0037B3B33B
MSSEPPPDVVPGLPARGAAPGDDPRGTGRYDGTPHVSGLHGGSQGGGQGGGRGDGAGGGPGGPYGGGPGGPYGGGPYGGPPGGEPPGGGPPGGGPGGPYGGGPYGPGGPYGDRFGAPDPLAGMPPLAGLGRRLLARIIDGLLIGIPVALVMALILGGYDPVDDTGASTVVTVVGALAYFVYEGLMLTSSGQTVGKRLMKIRVAMLADGSVPAGQAGWMRAAVYSLPEVVPCCGFIFWLVNVLWCTWDRPYRQCIHDKVAATVVVSAVP